MAEKAGEEQRLTRQRSAVCLDGSAAVEARPQRIHMMYGRLLALYVLGGMLFHYFVEGWNMLESFVFILSILTGCGYGHLIPASDLGLLVTSVYIFAGLTLFASIAGQLLDFMVESEISAVMEAVKASGSDDNADTSYRNAQKVDRWRHFMVGCINLGILCVVAMLLLQFAFGEDFVNSVYLSAVAALKMDSICLLDGVQCSHGRHAHSGGTAPSLFFALLWYVLTYGIIGHFIVSASNYLGVDQVASVSYVKTLTRELLDRMDRDGDGHVSRDEFLCDRLIQDGLCDQKAIDAILWNFDNLDKDGSGHLNKSDVSFHSRRGSAGLLSLGSV